MDRLPTPIFLGFPGSSDSKEFACNAGDPSSIPGLGRSTGEGKSYPLQYSGLENSTDREAWWATVHGVAESWTQKTKYKQSTRVFKDHTFSPSLCEQMRVRNQ